MNATVTVLGCGHSAGSPLIGNDWIACDASEPRNQRTRASIHIQMNDASLIIDTGPDFRNQINRQKINKIDAVLYTHYHADHTGGMDDLRHWCRRRKLEAFPLYMNDETYQVLRQRYDYLIEKEMDVFYPLLLKPHVLTPEQLYREVHLAGIPLTLFEQDHKTCTSIGVRVGNVAYSTDMLNLPERSIESLHGIDTWIVDAAAYKGEAFVHANLDIVFALNERIGARQLYLTHMPPTMDYHTLINELPPGCEPAYDSLMVEAVF